MYTSKCIAWTQARQQVSAAAAAAADADDDAKVQRYRCLARAV